MREKSTRLTRNLEKKSKKQLTLSIAGIIIFLVLVMKFGTNILFGISSFFIGINEKKSIQSEKLSNNVLQAPILDSIAQATNSATIKISGKSVEKNGKIEVYLNGTPVKEIDIKDDNTFEDTLDGLLERENEIKVRFKTSDKTSEFTKEQFITFSKKEPLLEITYPTDNQEFKKGDEQITVKGRTEPADNAITINGFRAIVDGNGNFSYFMKLNEGENTLAIGAESESGIKVKKEIKVRYSP